MASNKLLTTIAVAALAISLTATAQAGVTVTASVGGAPAGSIHDNLNLLALGSGGGLTATGIDVSFSGTGQVVNGSSSGVYAAPFLSGNNGSGFGSPDQGNGLDLTNYISAGGTSSPGGTPGATLGLPGEVHSFGLLWGSIDTYNTLELFDGSTLVGTVTGSDAAAAASTLPNGNQGTDGTAYVNVSSTAAFDKVEAFSSNYAFEFDDVSFSPNRVPEPLTLSLFGVGVAGAAALRRRRKQA